MTLRIRMSLISEGTKGLWTQPFPNVRYTSDRLLTFYQRENQCVDPLSFSWLDYDPPLVVSSGHLSALQIWQIKGEFLPCWFVLKQFSEQANFSAFSSSGFRIRIHPVYFFTLLFYISFVQSSTRFSTFVIILRPHGTTSLFYSFTTWIWALVVVSCFILKFPSSRHTSNLWRNVWHWYVSELCFLQVSPAPAEEGIILGV